MAGRPSRLDDRRGHATGIHLTPAAWLDNRRLIVVASSPDLSNEERFTGALMLLEAKPGERHLELRRVTGGASLTYLCWIR